MKFVVLMLMLVSAQSYASEVCKFEATWEFTEAFEETGKSEDHSAFSALEKKMIHVAVTAQEWLGNLTEEEALEHFGDFRPGKTEPGSMAGSITYFNENGKSVALVTYYPGDNEYGAFFEVSGKSVKRLAIVNDSSIECK